jgi:hypothetical protein
MVGSGLAREFRAGLGRPGRAAHGQVYPRHTNGALCIDAPLLTYIVGWIKLWSNIVVTHYSPDAPALVILRLDFFVVVVYLLEEPSSFIVSLLVKDGREYTMW